jgi:hypothetical protein
MKDIILESYTEVEFTPLLITTIVINFLIILIAIYLLFIYIKSKEFHSYSCGFVLILTFSILIDNIMRLIPISADEKYNVLHYIQAFILASLDKYILLVLTIQSFTIYLGIMKTDFYYEHKKCIFFTSFFTGMGLSFLIGGLYLLFGLDVYGLYYYVHGNDTKSIIDTIFNSVFLFFTLFFGVIIILNVSIRKEEIEKGMVNENDYEHNLGRIILMLIGNSLIYVESFLITYDSLPCPDDYIDLIYIITCLVINLIYAINSVVINSTKKIFCSKCYEKENPRTNTYQNVTTYTHKLSKQSDFSGEEYV